MSPRARTLRRERIGLLRPAPEPDVQIRALTDYDCLTDYDTYDTYDTALGLDGDQSDGGVA